MPFRLIPLIALLGLLPAPALASILIAPTTVQFDAGRRSAAIEITNNSDTDIDLQFRPYAWSQDDGREVLEPTEALAVSPAIATVPPHGRQVFRVLDRGGGSVGGQERSFRLRLNQIPRSMTRAVTINLEFSLPVFLTPARGEPRVSWAPAANAVRVANSGDRRLRITHLAVRQGGRDTPLASAASSYVLAGATRSFALPPAFQIRSDAHLVGLTDTGPVDVPLPALAAR